MLMMNDGGKKIFFKEKNYYQQKADKLYIKDAQAGNK